MIADTRNNSEKLILTIDDEPSIRNSFTMFLEDLGYRVDQAGNGEAGLQRFAEAPPDLVLLDLRMPGMSGFEVLRQLRDSAPDLPIIVISGTGRISDVVDALRLGAWDFLVKPVEDLGVLQHTIEKALERARLLTENLAYQKALEAKVQQRTAELEQVNQRLAASEEKYRSIFENLQDIYYETALDGTLLEVSSIADSGTSYSRNELLGQNMLALYADPDKRNDLLERLKLHGRVNDFELELLRKDGTVKSFSLNATLHRTPTGKPSHISGLLRDISQRKMMETALRTSSQTLAALFDAAPLAILAIDARQNVTLWNRTAEELFGWTRDQILGRPYPLAPEGREDEARHNLASAMAGKQFRGLEVSRRHRDGHLVLVNLSTAPLYDAAQQISGQVVIFEDVRELRKLRSESERAGRLASLGELAAGVAHEINNPNGLILLNLPTLREFVMDAINLQQDLLGSHPNLRLGGLSPGRAAEAFPRLLGEIEDSCRRVRQIVEDLKDFSRQDAKVATECFDLNQSAEKALRLAGNSLKKATAALRTELDTTLPKVNGSPQRIEQVIVNLLLNAAEALTNQKQGITLSTSYNAAQRKVTLCVADQGRGISADHLPHVTDPFFTTRRDSGGTGLGLSVSARIIREHGGELQFSSEPGQGTRVCLTLPAAGDGAQHD